MTKRLLGPWRRRLLWLVASVALSTGADAATRRRSPSLSPEQLTSQIRSLVQRKGLDSIRWGICIADARSGETVFAYHEDDLFVPASNRKLFVTALALHHLGPDYRFSTALLLSHAPENQSYFQGDLIVRGVGDPTFLNPRFNNGTMTTMLNDWADKIRALGIRRVEGDLVMDCSGFASDELPAEGWIKDYETAQYAPRVGAVCIGGNRVAVSILPGAKPGQPPSISLSPSNSVVQIDNQAQTGPRGSKDTVEIARAEGGPDRIIVRGRLAGNASRQVQRIPLEQPELVAGEVFRSVLEKKGIAVTGKVCARKGDSASTDTQWVRVTDYQSPPLREILAVTNKDSDNHCAEQLFQATTFARTGRTSYKEAKQFEEVFLARLGILPNAANFEDGSGLSRYNLVSPRATIRLLSYMANHPYAETFRQSLAVAGRDGTLAGRMGSRALGRVFAKTGSLSMACALSGYAQTQSGTVMTFSILANDCEGRIADTCYVQDRIAEWLVTTRFY